MYACARSKSAAWASLLGAAGDREQRTPGPGVVAYLAERPAARAADAGLPLAGRPPELGPSSSEALPSCLVSAPVSAALVDALAVVRARAPCSPGAVPGRGARGAVPATPGVRAGAAPGGERASQRVTRRGCSRSPLCTDGGVRHPGGDGVPGACMRKWVLTWLRSLRGCAAAWHRGSCTCNDLQLPHELKHPPRGGSRLPARKLRAIRREDGDAACGKHARELPCEGAGPRLAPPRWGPNRLPGQAVQPAVQLSARSLSLLPVPQARATAPPASAWRARGPAAAAPAAAGPAAAAAAARPAAAGAKAAAAAASGARRESQAAEPHRQRVRRVCSCAAAAALACVDKALCGG